MMNKILLFVIAISLFATTSLFIYEEYDLFKNFYHGVEGFDNYVEYIGIRILIQSYLLNFVIYPLIGILMLKHLFKKE